MESGPKAREAPLESFARAHALTLLTGLAGSVRAGTAWGVAGLAAVNFGLLVWLGRRELTPRGNFGLANALTSLRVCAVLALSLPIPLLSVRAGAALATVILGLDGLDGWVARQRGETSRFGAYFDMETDAVFVLMVTLRLHLYEGYPAWVLSAGALRYVYVLAVWLLPGSGREAPRSLLGRLAFLLLALGLILGLAWPGPVGTAGVLVGTLLVGASFARSFYFSHFAS